jgi:hypothetical protein
MVVVGVPQRLLKPHSVLLSQGAPAAVGAEHIPL